MGIFTKALDVARAVTGKVRFPGRSLVFFEFGKIDVEDLAKEVGDGTSADVLMSPIKWLQRSIVEAPWQALDEEEEIIEDSQLIKLLNRPNPFYDGKVLLAGSTLSMSLDGNAYWIAALNKEGLPVELWYAPHTNVEPKWPSNDSSKFITYYEYNVGGKQQKIAPAGVAKEDIDSGVEDGLVMLHFREGVDLDNLRKGLSPLKGLLREVWTDNEAASYASSLLKNMAIPGVVVSPANSDATFTPDEAKAIKDKLIEEYGGSGRGRPLVALGPTKVEQFGFNPQQMELTALRDIAEERVTAALGVPAAVVGFGAGLQQTAVGATMKELRQMGWTGGVIPLQNLFAGEATNSLAPLFDEGIKVISFNNLGVEALRENQDTKANRIQRLVTAGIMTRGEGRTELGFEATEADNVFLMSMATIEVPRELPRSVEESPDEDPEDEPKAIERIKAWLKMTQAKQDDHDPNETRIIEAAPQARPTARVARAARRLVRIARTGGRAMLPGLEATFEDLGQSALSAASEVLATDEPKSYEKADLSAADRLLAEQIAGLTDATVAQQAMTVDLAEGYLIVGEEVASAVGSTLGVEFQLSEQAQAQFLRAGGTRAGLIDLEQQTRDAIFESMAAGREQGLAGDGLARFIASDVEGGPWGSALTRARVIARTEGATASNLATLEVAREMPETNHVQVFDNRSGTNDEECMRADGAIITIEEAESIGLAHPNCTRGFVPINALLMEEMGISGPMSRLGGEEE